MGMCMVRAGIIIDIAGMKVQKTLLKGILFLLTGALLIGFAIALIFAAINWNDEELLPEIAPYLQVRMPQSESASNAFYDLLGITTAQNKNPRLEGKRVTDQWLAEYQQASATGTFLEKNKYAPLPPDLDTSKLPSIKPCPPTHADCLAYYANERRLLDAQNDRLQTFLTRWQALILQPTFEEIIIPDPEAKMPEYGLLAKGHYLSFIDAIKEIDSNALEAGLGKLQQANNFFRKMLVSSQTLIGKMIALRQLQESARLVDAILKSSTIRQVRQHEKIFQNLLAPIDLTKANLKPAFETECRYKLVLLSEMYKDRWQALKRGDMDFFTLTFAYQHHATLNAAYRECEKIVAWSNLPIENFEQWATEEQDSNRYYAWWTLKNPAGKILLNLSLARFSNYAARLYDTDTYLQMLRLKLRLTLNQTPPARMKEALMLDIDSKSRYDGKIFDYSPESGELKFTGRAKHLFLPDPGNVFVVKL